MDCLLRERRAGKLATLISLPNTKTFLYGNPELLESYRTVWEKCLYRMHAWKAAGSGHQHLAPPNHSRDAYSNRRNGSQRAYLYCHLSTV